MISVMLSDFINIRTLDRFHQIGRYAQLAGALMIVGPSFAAVTNVLVPSSVPNPFLDKLPEFNPSAIAYRHPLWSAAAIIPIGIVAIVVGTQFLSKRPWAARAMNRLCWFGLALLLIEGALFGVSALSVQTPVLIVFSVAAILLCGFFAHILFRTTRDLKRPDVLGQFRENGTPDAVR